MKKPLLFILLLVGFYSRLAQAEDFYAEIEKVNADQSSFEYLTFDQEDLRVQSIRRDQKRIPYVRIKGKFNRPGWSLKFKDKVLSRGDSHPDFSLKIALKDRTTSMLFTAEGPQKAEKLRIQLNFPKYHEYVSTSGGRKSKSAPTIFMISAGYSTIHYKETGVPDFDMNVVTGKIFYLNNFMPHWDVGASVYVTGFTVSASRTDVSMRFLGANLRFGYSMYFGGSRLSLLGGWYLTTTFVTNNAFGFKNMAGPQLYPMLTFGLSRHSDFMMYAKYSPVVGLSFSDREIAVGGGYIYKFTDEHPLSLNVDMADLSFTLDRVKVESKSLTFSLGYGF